MIKLAGAARGRMRMPPRVVVGCPPCGLRSDVCAELALEQDDRGRSMARMPGISSDHRRRAFAAAVCAVQRLTPTNLERGWALAETEDKTVRCQR